MRVEEIEPTLEFRGDFDAARLRLPLMGWSGRAPAPPVSEPCQGRQSQGARYVSATQHDDRRHWCRYRQELVPRCGPRSARRHRAAAEMVTRPGGITVCQHAALPDRDGGLRRAHHLSRQLKGLGHDARLMPAKYVRPYSKGQKNDFRDAEAI